MKRLWAPWRMKFVEEHAEDCVFCTVKKQVDDVKNLIVFRGQTAYVILNRFPYTNGHILIVPFDHLPSLEATPPETLTEMTLLAREFEAKLRAAYNPDGMNLGMNLGRSAGAGIADHIHLHMLPRWTGDTNFMTVTGESRVLPEELDVTWTRLREIA